MNTKGEKGEKREEASSEIKKKTSVTTFGTRKTGQKRTSSSIINVDSPPIKSQKRGMLAFSEDSDSDCL